MESSGSGVSECVREPRKGKYGEEGLCPLLLLSNVPLDCVHIQYFGYENKVTSNTDQYMEYVMERWSG